MQELQRVDIYQALNKPNLVFGADRELVLFNMLISFTLIFTGLTLISTLIGCFILFAGGFLLRTMAKHDPLMKDIFQRQIKYKKYYVAQASYFSYLKA
ncbi:VirB3 family type IV secretion system protein [Campylobacter sp. RM12640]|uniref:conjugal transfer protein TrbD n=1 Tax=unclassified Campylobacter TaxID=2593542 RepID=UPI001D680336|nr:VirB3 family type IV secretion system protein [Campylobacter sp. RM12642]MBZ7982460.1 VirB3 family type IV secretion system protein [Campylobacter sp. RM12640]MBZ7989965.1 VirB3 family type IV secretion system protein [Campylobacter sp. RM12635]MBZ8008222.1 VirB3 family type IV secretion system protein [Campylobacter sp. RM9334]